MDDWFQHREKGGGGGLGWDARGKGWVAGF